MSHKRSKKARKERRLTVGNRTTQKNAVMREANMADEPREHNGVEEGLKSEAVATTEGGAEGESAPAAEKIMIEENLETE